MKTATEIREVLQQYLRSEGVRDQLPSDWAPRLPLEVGAVEVDPDGSVRLGVWRLAVEGERARLDHHPSGSSNAQHRLWFRIRLVRANGAWEIVPPGVSLVHAWARR